jgi:hypothetical protein
MMPFSKFICHNKSDSIAFKSVVSFKTMAKNSMVGENQLPRLTQAGLIQTRIL